MVDQWDQYFSSVENFLRESERQYGLGNDEYVQYVLEQLEVTQLTCQVLLRTLSRHVEFHEQQQLLSGLIGCLRTLRIRWQEYADRETSYVIDQPLVAHLERVGRPRFDVRKEELEYLMSLSFSWNEIAALIGVSRSTLYRYA